MTSDLLTLINFNEYTLTNVQLQIATAVIAFIFTLTGITAVVSYPKDKRKMAWIISLVNAFVLSIAAGIYMCVKFSLIRSDIRTAIHSVDNVSAVISIWLCLANIFDLFFGLIFYRSHLDPLTAYVHHTLYIWITIVAVSGNGGFDTFEPYAGGAAFLLIEEFPTFLLALGSVFPAFRTDLGFGITFFLFRLVFHAAIMYAGVVNGMSQLMTNLFGITMIMHAFWFYSWFSKYGKKIITGDKSLSEKSGKRN